jgi:hypothetical protein
MKVSRLRTSDARKMGNLVNAVFCRVYVSFQIQAARRWICVLNHECDIVDTSNPGDLSRCANDMCGVASLRQNDT